MKNIIKRKKAIYFPFVESKNKRREEVFFVEIILVSSGGSKFHQMTGRVCGTDLADIQSHHTTVDELPNDNGTGNCFEPP